MAGCQSVWKWPLLNLTSGHNTRFKVEGQSRTGHDSVKYSSLSMAMEGQDSVGGTATRYGLDGPGITSRWRRDFSAPSRPTLGPTQPPIQWVPGFFQVVKRSTTHPHLAPKLRKQYSYISTPRTVLGWTLLLSYEWMCCVKYFLSPY